MKLLPSSRVTLLACAVLASATAACATRAARPAATGVPPAPAPCGPNRVGAGWIEVRSTIAPVSLCVPPDVQLSPGKQFYARPLNQLPYPRPRSRVEAWEAWRMPDGRTVMETSLHTGPDEPQGRARGAAGARETRVTAGCRGAVAILKDFRVPAVWNQPEPGADRAVDTYNAYLELPLGPMRRLTLEAVARDTIERAKLISVLRSACRLDER